MATKNQDTFIYIICTRFCFKGLIIVVVVYQASTTLACKILGHNCLTYYNTDQEWLSGTSTFIYHVTFCYAMDLTVHAQQDDNWHSIGTNCISWDLLSLNQTHFQGILNSHMQQGCLPKRPSIKDVGQGQRWLVGFNPRWNHLPVGHRTSHWPPCVHPQYRNSVF